MKLKNIISLMAGTLLGLAACSPDDYGFGAAQYSADDLKCPDAFTVDINGNRVKLTSKISGCTPLWITPNGRSQDQEVNLEMPFAGDYEVTFGAETRGGAVYGKPYTFNIAQNDFSLLDDDLWFMLAKEGFRDGDPIPDEATLSQGISKKWYPNDKDYGLGCIGPVMYMCPYDIANKGAGAYTPEEEANKVYKDVPFGRNNWNPNWDCGYQSWWIASDQDPYMASYMEFSMDAKNGCVAKVYRGETGTSTSSTGTSMTGKFNLGLMDKAHPTISFTDCYALHNLSFDDVCSNYTNNIIVAELTPYYLCLITKRTNSEGNWYIVWNFVSEEVKKTNGACIPAADKVLSVYKPVLKLFDNLAEDAFAVESNGVTYHGNKVTYTVDTEAPYDWMWWNGADGVGAWKELLNGSYNNTWAPMPEDDADELVLSSAVKDGKKTYTYECGEQEGTVTFGDNTITFSNGIKFLTATNDFRTVTVEGKTFTVLKQSPTEGMTIGVPDKKNVDGKPTSYLCVNLKVKPIGAPQTGPVAIPLKDDRTPYTAVEAGKYLRLVFYNMYMSPADGLLKDPASIKVKKDQTLRVKFTLKSGLTWTKAPKCALIDNNIKTTWEPGCFDLEDAVLVNTSGETVVTLKNTTGSTVKITDTAFQLSIQLQDCLEGFDPNVETAPDIIQSVSCELE